MATDSKNNHPQQEIDEPYEVNSAQFVLPSKKPSTTKVVDGVR